MAYEEITRYGYLQSARSESPAACLYPITRSPATGARPVRFKTARFSAFAGLLDCESRKRLS